MNGKPETLKLQSGLFVSASKQYRTDTGLYIPYSARLSASQIEQAKKVAEHLTVLPNYQETIKRN